MYGLLNSVCCACDPSMHLDAPSICCACIFVCRKFRVCSSYVVSLCDFTYCVSGKSMQLLCIYPLVCCACLPSV